MCCVHISAHDVAVALQGGRLDILQLWVVASGEAISDARDLAKARAARELAQMRRVVVAARTAERIHESSGGGLSIEMLSESTVDAVESLVGLRFTQERVRQLPNGDWEVAVLVEVDEDEVLPQQALQRAAAAPMPADRCQAMLELARQRWLAGRHALALQAFDAAVREGDAAGPPWKHEARLQRARFHADQGHASAAYADLTLLESDPALDGVRAAALGHLRLELAQRRMSLREVPQHLEALATAAARPKVFRVNVELVGGTVMARWSLAAEPSVLLLIFADDEEIMVSEPRDSRAVSGSGSLHFKVFPARVWCWALAPDSPVLSLVRSMQHRRVGLRDAPVAAEVEWFGLIKALRVAAGEAHPPPACAWTMPTP